MNSSETDKETEILPVVLDDGFRMYIETSVVPGEREQVGAKDQAAANFATVANTIRKLTTEIRAGAIAAKPDETELEFGMDVKVESDGLVAILLKGETSANIKVTMKWKGSESA